MKSPVKFLMLVTAVLIIRNVSAETNSDNLISAVTNDAQFEQDARQRIIKAPLAFTENLGQFHESILAKSSSSPVEVIIVKNGMYFNVFKTTRSSRKPMFDDEGNLEMATPEYRRLSVGAFLIDANDNPTVVMEKQLEHKSNYFIGNDPKLWFTNVPNYVSVLLEDVYPGIDIRYYGSNGTLEFDLLLEPGANPDQIKFDFRSANSIAINDQGDLELHTDLATIVLLKPNAYHAMANTTVNVETEFVIYPDQTVGFKVGKEHNPILALVIDPVVHYASYFGGDDDEEAWDVVVDGCGNAYIVGYTNSSESENFPFTTGAYDVTYNDTNNFMDVFVAKFNTKEDGAASLIYSTYLGGGTSDLGFGIDIDDDGNAYITGYTLSDNFPVTTGAFDESHNGSGDVFVSKIGPSGDSLIYSTFLGGVALDMGRGVKVDANGAAYVTGLTTSSSFPTTSGVLNESFLGGTDVFVTEINSAGSGLDFSTFVGGVNGDLGYDIDIDSDGDCYVTGVNAFGLFPLEKAFDSIVGDASYYEPFMFKLKGDGTELLYSTYVGGDGLDYAYSIVVDNNKMAYITGYTEASDFPVKNAFDGTLGGTRDAFVTKIDPSATGASSLIYSTYLGGAGTEEGWAISLDGDKAVVVGNTNSTDFDTEDPIQSSKDTGLDGFITKFNAAGDTLLFSTYYGGDGDDEPYGVDVDDDGSIYVAIETASTDFISDNPPLLTPFQNTLKGDEDGALVKIVADPDTTVCTLGDVNRDGIVDYRDSDYLLAYMFFGGPAPTCTESADMDCSGDLWVSDLTYLAIFLVNCTYQPNCTSCTCL